MLRVGWYQMLARMRSHRSLSGSRLWDGAWGRSGLGISLWWSKGGRGRKGAKVQASHSLDGVLGTIARQSRPTVVQNGHTFAPPPHSQQSQAVLRRACLRAKAALSAGRPWSCWAGQWVFLEGESIWHTFGSTTGTSPLSWFCCDLTQSFWTPVWYSWRCACPMIQHSTPGYMS